MNKIIISFLINLKNNSLSKNEFTSFKYSKDIHKITILLYEEGYIQSYKILNTNKIFIQLRYYFNLPIINKFKVLSSPSYSNILTKKKLHSINTKRHTLFISTNKGLMTLQQAKEFKIGGLLLFIC
jgi:ribosomal protein S8